MTIPDERDVHSTAEEAERLLAELEGTISEPQAPGAPPSGGIGRFSD